MGHYDSCYEATQNLKEDEEYLKRRGYDPRKYELIIREKEKNPKPFTHIGWATEEMPVRVRLHNVKNRRLSLSKRG